MIGFERLEHAVREQLGDGISVALEDPKDPEGDLFPTERTAISAAVQKRKLEFTAGRVAARRAMDIIGIERQAIPQGRDRAPVWPAGVTGAITHCDAVCIAAVAKTDNLSSIGIDLEPETDLPRDLESTICTPAERAWLENMPDARRGALSKLIFSAKESAYKAQYPLTQTLFGFETFKVDLDPGTGRFMAVFQNPIGRFATGDTLQGRFVVAQGHIFTSVVI